MLKALNRFTACGLICCAIAWGLYAPASVTGNQSVAESRPREVAYFLERSQVRAQLESQGVAAEVAKERVDALSDDEVKMLAGHIGQLPEGSSEILGLLLVVFLILYITDTLGLTKVLPFTRSIR